MNNPKISIIVALGDKNGIGKSNGLMWRIPSELKHFKEITTGHPIIMGRKTHESIGKALPNRKNIVISRDSQYRAEGCIVVNSLDQAIAEAQKEEANEIFIIGGGQIYEQSLLKADKLYLTHVLGDFQADVFFQDYSDFKKIVYKSELLSDNGYQFYFEERERYKCRF